MSVFIPMPTSSLTFSSVVIAAITSFTVFLPSCGGGVCACGTWAELMTIEIAQVNVANLFNARFVLLCEFFAATHSLAQRHKDAKVFYALVILAPNHAVPLCELLPFR